MKFILMLGGTGLALLLCFLPSLAAPKPRWWKILTMLAVATTTFFALWPPIAGSITDVVMQGRANPIKQVPAYVVPDPASAQTTEQGLVTMQAADARTPRLHITLSMHKPLADKVQAAGAVPMVLLLRRADSDVLFAADAVVAVDPALTLPYIMALEERARIIFFHVPMSWIATIAYLLAMIFGIRYLRTRNLAHDDAVVATASVGTLFAVLATTTGSVWAKFNWGSFWNWDPRQTSIVVLLLIYAAFFLLRSAIDDPQRRARLSSVYAIVAFVAVPFLVFIIPRMVTSLHPGGKGDAGGAGPLLSTSSDAINPTKQVLFALSLFAFTLVYGWLVNLRIRMLAMQRRLDNQSAASS
ncbi:MAG: hypothetical protein FGM24_05980 [Candidatus Kapabacteria bacterium]|nr:hypothetical protein [Candidatus Kapabacteria bacterium]